VHGIHVVGSEMKWSIYLCATLYVKTNLASILSTSAIWPAARS